MGIICSFPVFIEDATGGYDCVPCGNFGCNVSKHCVEIMTPVGEDTFFLCGRTDSHIHCPKCWAANCTNVQHGVSSS